MSKPNPRLRNAAVAALIMAGTLPRSACAGGSVPAWLTGVNLSGAEFNAGKTRINFDYVYPTQAAVSYYSKKGMTVFRVPVLTERLLSANGRAGPDWRALMSVISAAAATKAFVILDVHQYGAMPSGLVGRSQFATAAFVNAWTEIAYRLKSTPNVIFGLMNEPNQQSAAEWVSGVNAAIGAIRRAGADQLILVPGSYWDGAHSWTSTDNGRVMLGIQDPADNYVYEVHQYLDQNSSGTKPDVVKGSGKASLVAFTNWARAHHKQGFLGEFGFAAAPEALAEGQDLLAYMAANKDVWRGWTYWAGGPWWGNYMFSVEPSNGTDKPQMNLLVKYK